MNSTRCTSFVSGALLISVAALFELHLFRDLVAYLAAEGAAYAERSFASQRFLLEVIFIPGAKLLPYLMLAWLAGLMLHELLHILPYLVVASWTRRAPKLSVYCRCVLLRVTGWRIAARSMCGRHTPYFLPRSCLSRSALCFIALTPLFCGALLLSQDLRTPFLLLVALVIFLGAAGDIRITKDALTHRQPPLRIYRRAGNFSVNRCLTSNQSMADGGKPRA